jgi:type I restriction enzyme S subunit
MRSEDEFPLGWVTATLGDVAMLVKDKVEPSQVPDTPYVGLEHVEAHSMRLLGCGQGSDVRSTKNRFAAGDVLYGKLRPYLNKVVRPDFDGICSTDFLVFRESPELDAGYLAYFLNQLAIASQAHHLSSGMELPRVSWAVLSNLAIAYPNSKDLQREVVREITASKLLALSSNEHQHAARRALERFRRSILASACSGRLTAEWRSANPSTTSGEDVVASIVDARRKRLGRRFKEPSALAVEHEVPEGWTWTSLGALVDVATGATPLRKRVDYYGGVIPWVTSGAVNAGLITEATEHITELALKETNAKIFPAGSLLVAMYGEGQTRGRVAELGIAAATNQAVAALLFDEANEFLRDYLRVFLLENYERIRQLSFGGVQPNLSLGVIKDTPVPLPPRDEQREIVRRVDVLTALSDDVKRRADKTARHVSRGSQAVLAKAFRGELT